MTATQRQHIVEHARALAAGTRSAILCEACDTFAANVTDETSDAELVVAFISFLARLQNV